MSHDKKCVWSASGTQHLKQIKKYMSCFVMSSSILDTGYFVFAFFILWNVSCPRCY